MEKEPNKIEKIKKTKTEINNEDLKNEFAEETYETKNETMKTTKEKTEKENKDYC